jgi:hypothetical protein
MTAAPKIDMELLRDELESQQPAAGRSRARWVIRRSAATFAASYVFLFALPALLAGHGLRAFRGTVLFVQLGASLAFAAMTAVFSLRGSRGSMEVRLERSARSLERGWVRMTQGHWVLRVVLTGVAMAAAIGLSVGTLVAMKSPHDDLLAGSRLLTGLAFCGLTLAWCIPMAFVIRWFYLRWARQFITAA